MRTTTLIRTRMRSGRSRRVGFGPRRTESMMGCMTLLLWLSIGQVC
jgi:hypothetical protein